MAAAGMTPHLPLRSVHDDDLDANYLMEGFPIGMAAFLLSWTLSYTASL